MDKEFLSFCIIVIQFFKKEKDLFDSAAHLLDCLDFKVLLREEFEKILRIILREGNERGLDIEEYLRYISEIKAENELIEISFDANKLPEID